MKSCTKTLSEKLQERLLKNSQPDSKSDQMIIKFFCSLAKNISAIHNILRWILQGFKYKHYDGYEFENLSKKQNAQ